jgi:hypothetical protein
VFLFSGFASSRGAALVSEGAGSTLETGIGPGLGMGVGRLEGSAARVLAALVRSSRAKADQGGKRPTIWTLVLMVNDLLLGVFLEPTVPSIVSSVAIATLETLARW